MIAIAKGVAQLFFYLSFACFLFLGNGLSKSSAEAADPLINGSSQQIGDQQILNLWGSNYEMGYAHGYLMADKIRDLIDTYAIGTMASGNVAHYTNFLNFQAQTFIFYPQYLDEISGIVAGMIASGKDLYVTKLKRNVDDRDIKAFNLLPELYFFCSSFGVWGNATANGETIVARNLDFYYDPQGNFVNDQILITYEPLGGAKFVSFSWPGLIGLASGLNEDGISVMINMGFGDNSNSVGPFHPSLEVMRYILESSTSANYLTQPIAIVNSVEEYSTFILQIGSPFNGSANPVYYIEDSSTQNVIRYAADSDPAYNQIVATNHFMKVTPPPTSGDSVNRYNLLRNGLIGLYSKDDGKVDSTESQALLQSVADWTTLTSIIIRPNRMEFDLAIAKMVTGNFTKATDMPSQTYSWANLFPNHGVTAAVPDLAVQSIVADPSSPASGQTLNVTVTVKNQGSAAAGGFRIDFYKDLVSVPAINQYGDANCRKAGLAAGAADTCIFPVTYSAAGGYSMRAQVDTEQQVTESNEANNVFGPQAIVVGAPDLIISALSKTGTASACQTISVLDTTKNTALFPGGNSTTQFYWSTNSTYDSNDLLLGSRAIGPLAGGMFSSGGTAVTVPCGATGGNYYIIARADADNMVTEANENNNNKSLAVNVTAPDLIISSLSAPLKVKACQIVSVADTTKNTGSGKAETSTTKFYWSKNVTFDPGDGYLGSRAVNALTANAYSAGNTSVTIPCGTASGNYYIIAQGDADNVVAELNEQNNIRNRAITVSK